MSGQTVLVVGASSGVGLGLVQAWLEAGWRIVAKVRDGAGGHRFISWRGAERDG